MEHKGVEPLSRSFSNKRIIHTFQFVRVFLLRTFLRVAISIKFTIPNSDPMELPNDLSPFIASVLLMLNLCQSGLLGSGFLVWIV